MTEYIAQIGLRTYVFYNERDVIKAQRLFDAENWGQDEFEDKMNELDIEFDYEIMP